MPSQITVILSNGDERKFVLSEADLARMDSAKAAEWLGREFDSAGGITVNKLGKLLIVDKVIALARAQPESEFIQPTPWISEFLRAVAVTIDRKSIIIDLPSASLSY